MAKTGIRWGQTRPAWLKLNPLDNPGFHVQTWWLANHWSVRLKHNRKCNIYLFKPVKFYPMWIQRYIYNIKWKKTYAGNTFGVSSNKCLSWCSHLLRSDVIRWHQRRRMDDFKQRTELSMQLWNWISHIDKPVSCPKDYSTVAMRAPCQHICELWPFIDDWILESLTSTLSTI